MMRECWSTCEMVMFLLSNVEALFARDVDQPDLALRAIPGPPAATGSIGRRRIKAAVPMEKRQGSGSPERDTGVTG